MPAVTAGFLPDGGAEAAAGRNVQPDETGRSAQLSRTGATPLYAESVGQVILMCIPALRPSAPRVGALLPKWRLRRVQKHVDASIANAISVMELAKTAGLLRMHFAAQFRPTTSCGPLYVLLQHRVKLIGTDAILVDAALSVCLQTQSHFSTMFKRLAGNTSAHEQRIHRAVPR